MTFRERLDIYREALYFKSIKDMKHIDRIEGPINPAVTLSIKLAIKNRYMLTIYYIGDKQEKPGWRLIMPFCYGLNRFTFNHVLRAYQVSGPSVSQSVPYWRMFRLDRIFNIAANTTKTFDRPIYLWNPKGDLGMASVISIIKFPKGTGSTGISILDLLK
jgi:hypothetical protein